MRAIVPERNHNELNSASKWGEKKRWKESSSFNVDQPFYDGEMMRENAPRLTKDIKRERNEIKSVLLSLLKSRTRHSDSCTT